MQSPPLAVTAGEPAGIGFDIILQSCEQLNDCIIIADQYALAQRAETLGLNVNVCDYPATASNQIFVQHVPALVPVKCGELNQLNAKYVLSCLDEAIAGTLEGKYCAITTAPLHKGIINDAGIPFTGHTEYFADKTNSNVVMLLVADDVRVALVTMVPWVHWLQCSRSRAAFNGARQLCMPQPEHSLCFWMRLWPWGRGLRPGAPLASNRASVVLSLVVA